MTVSDLAPRAVVVGLVAFGVWPAVSQFLYEEKPKPPEKIADLAAAMLSPKLPPRPTHDPFGMPVLAKRSSTKQPVKVGSGTRPLSRSAVAATKNAGGPVDKAGSKPVDPLSGLTLTGTCIMGEQRLAVINGRLYAPEETISTGKPAANKPAMDKALTDKTPMDKSVTDKSATSSYQVVDVFPYKVLLAHDGHIVELVYSNVSSGPAPAARGGAKGAGANKSHGGSSGKSGRSSKTGK